MGYQSSSKDDVSAKLLQTSASRIFQNHSIKPPHHAIPVLPHVPEMFIQTRESNNVNNDNNPYQPENFVRHVIQAYETKIKEEKKRLQTGKNTDSSTIVDESGQRKSTRSLDISDFNIFDFGIYHDENHYDLTSSPFTPRKENEDNSKLQKFFSKSRLSKLSKICSPNYSTRKNKSRSAEDKTDALPDFLKRETFLSRCRRKITGEKCSHTPTDDRQSVICAYIMSSESTDESNSNKNLQNDKFNSSKQRIDKVPVFYFGSDEENDASDQENTYGADPAMNLMFSSSCSDRTTIIKNLLKIKMLKKMLSDVKQFFLKKANVSKNLQVQQDQYTNLINSEFKVLPTISSTFFTDSEHSNNEMTATFTTFHPSGFASRQRIDGVKRRLMLREYSHNEALERWHELCHSYWKMQFPKILGCEFSAKCDEIGEATVLEDDCNDNFQSIESSTSQLFKNNLPPIKMSNRFCNTLMTIYEEEQEKEIASK